MKLPVYFNGVRTHAAVSAAIAALLLPVLLRPDSGGVTAETRILLELATPLPLLLVSAGLLQSDSGLALLAVKPVRLASLLLARWSLALTVTLVIPAAGHAVHILRAEPDSAVNVLAWLAPMLFLSAVTMATSAVTANTTAGLSAGIGYWAASILLSPALLQRCADTAAATCAVAVWSTAYGLIAEAGSGWEWNRVFLLLGSLILLATLPLVYRNPERQIRATKVQEAVT